MKNMFLLDAVLLACVLKLLNIEDDAVVGAVKKCYWIFALTVMTGGMLVSVTALTKAYLSYPVGVEVSVRREKQLVFPAVTVCNMSPVKKSALETADLSGASKRRKKRQLFQPIAFGPAGAQTLSYNCYTYCIIMQFAKSDARLYK